MVWKTIADAKKYAFENGFNFLVMFGDKPAQIYRSENEAKANARMWRNSDKIPDVSIKKFRF